VPAVVRKILLGQLEQRFGPLSRRPRATGRGDLLPGPSTRLSERSLTARSLAALAALTVAACARPVPLGKSDPPCASFNLELLPRRPRQGRLRSSTRWLRTSPSSRSVHDRRTNQKPAFGSETTHARHRRAGGGALSADRLPPRRVCRVRGAGCRLRSA